MVDYKYAELYQQNSVDKQLNIVFDGGEITNTDIHSEQFELTESICSDSQLRFGSCEASVVKFRISNIFTPLKDKWMTVTETLNHNVDTPFQFGKYKVHSDTPTADRRHRDVVAYDKMYDIINTDLTEWYNSLFPTDDTEVTLKEFRTSLMTYLGVEQEDVTLVNDNMVIKKTIQPTQLAGRDVVSAICEINGCFGHIGRDGKIHYVFLPKYAQGLYPSNDLYPADDLLPREQVTNKIDKSLYIDCKYEDYLSQKITKIQIRQEENDIGKTYPDGNVTDNDNVYSVTDNFLVYGKEETELEDIAKKLYSVIYGTEYRPYEAEVVGNPCLEVGDAIRFNTSYQIVESYILKRKLSGVQGLRDDLSADGEEYLSENASGIESQIQQIKGKSNVLERNIDETVSKISDVEQGLKSEISQTAESITSTVASAQSKWNTVDSDGNIVSISEYGYGLDGTITGSSYIFSDTLNVGDIYLDQETGYGWGCTSISSIDGKRVALFGYRPKHTFSLITDELSSQIEQTAESIDLKVSKGDVSSELSLESGQVSIKGDRLVIESTNFTLDEKGSAVATNFIMKNGIKIRSGEKDATVISMEKNSDTGQVYFVNIGSSDISFINIYNETEFKSGMTAQGTSYFRNLTVLGTKSRIASTKNYNDRLLYCYEMPSPLFGDIGHGITGYDGLCYVDIDSIFAETIDTIQQYYVFLQPYSDKPLYIKEKNENYFVVYGEPNTEFDWEIKAKQSDFPMERLEENSNEGFSDIDYVSSAEKYLENYEKELTV